MNVCPSLAVLRGAVHVLVLYCLSGSHTEYPRSHNTHEFNTEGAFQQEIGSLRCPTAVQTQTCDKRIWLLQVLDA